jgi:hypothetical protein
MSYVIIYLVAHDGFITAIKIKSLPRFGGRLVVGFFLCFTPQDHLPPEIIPVVVVVVIMVRLIIISVMPVK